MRRTPVLLVAAALVLGACGSDDDETATDEVAEDAPATSAGGTTGDTTGDTSGGTGEADSTCAAAAEEAAPEQGRESFPDNPDVTWNVLGSRTDEEGRAVVEVEPSSPEVGYPGFLFLSECPTEDDAVLLAVYAWEGGTWNILFTTDDLGPVELEPSIVP